MIQTARSPVSRSPGMQIPPHQQHSDIPNLPPPRHPPKTAIAALKMSSTARPARPASPYADVDMAGNADPDAVSVLFVCLGNICRASPAESPATPQPH